MAKDVCNGKNELLILKPILPKNQKNSVEFVNIYLETILHIAYLHLAFGVNGLATRMAGQ